MSYNLYRIIVIKLKAIELLILSLLTDYLFNQPIILFHTSNFKVKFLINLLIAYIIIEVSYFILNQINLFDDPISFIHAY